MRRRLLLVGGLAALAAGACGSDSGSSTSPVPGAPSTPTPAPEPPPPEPPENLEVHVRFGGPLYLPGATLQLLVGESLELPVATDLWVFGSEDAPETVSILVKTDAPPTVLSVPDDVRISGRSQPETASVEIRALAAPSDAGGNPGSGDYQVWLEAEPGVQRDWGVDPTRLRIAIADPSPPPSCDRIGLNARSTGRHWGGGLFAYVFDDVRDYYRSVELTFKTEHPGLSVRLLDEYLEWFGASDTPFFNSYPTFFAFDFSLAESAAGIEQELELGYFNELRLRAEIPGCESLDVVCNASGSCRTERANLTQ